MKLIEFDWYSGEVAKSGEDSIPFLGCSYLDCYERPLMLFPKPDRVYWHYIVLIISFWKPELRIQIRLNKMPYKNIEQYLKFVKERRR